MSTIIRLFREKRRRLLREYRRYAQRQHVCWNCAHPILPGDEYIGEVWVSPPPSPPLSVVKYHVNCPWETFAEETERIFAEESQREEEEATAHKKVA